MLGPGLGRRGRAVAGDALRDTDVVEGYSWLLGRIPGPGEIAAARDYFGSGADPRGAFRNGVMISEEFRGCRIRAQQHMRVAQVDLFRPKLVLVHIEKCGGTTLRTMLASQFVAARICPERFNGLADWTAHELAAYDFFAGHFDLACCDVVPGRNTAVVTMLREPKARLLSLFNFWKAHLPQPAFDDRTLVGLARGCTAVEFFSHPAVVRHPSIRDAIAGQLTRTVSSIAMVDGFPVLQADDSLLAAPGEYLEAAWNHVVGLTSFGLLEQFDVSRRLMNRQLGLQMQAIEPQQVLRTATSTMIDARRQPEEMSDRLEALLDALTPIDRELYRRAVELFEQRSAGLGEK